jgi:hypothetical protein
LLYLLSYIEASMAVDGQTYISIALVLTFAAGLVAIAIGQQNAAARSARDFAPSQLVISPGDPISPFTPGFRERASPGDPVAPQFSPGHEKILENGGGGQGP